MAPSRSARAPAHSSAKRTEARHQSRAAQAEGSRFFDGLVKEGEAWEARRRERSGEQEPGWRDNVEHSLDEAREKAREEARKKLEELSAKTKEAPKPLPEFGSSEDFPLLQALNQLKGKPVAVSKTQSERKAELDADKR